MSIKPAHRRYFRFWMDGVLYQWQALPFSFKNSMQIMARIMAPVITKMEAFGINVIIWVDDMILQLGTVKSIARQKALIALQILHNLGFLVNTEKTAKDVSKEVKFQGFCWNTKTFTISAPEKKLLLINKAAKKINMECASPKDLASLIGKVRYISQVHTHTIAWIMELEIHKNNLIKKGGWICRAPVPEEARVEIRHWRSCSFLLSMPLRTELHHMIQTMGDAGSMGYGFQGFGDQAGLWTPQEQLKSTNWRELETWRRQVLDYSEDLMDEVSIYGTDSSTVKAYISKIYGKEPTLSRMAAATWKFMEKHNILQLPILLSQEEIKSSDHLSWLSDKEDYFLLQESFENLCFNLQTFPTLDTFATRFSTKMERFCSRRTDPLAVATDAFSIPWSNETIYTFPPSHLIHQTLSKAKAENVTLLLVHSYVPSATWFHRINKIKVTSLSIHQKAIQFPQETSDQSFRWMISLIQL